MLFSQKKEPKAKQTNGLQRPSIWRLLFNPELGRETKPLADNFRMFAHMLAVILASNRLFPKDHPIFIEPNARISLSEVFLISWRRLSFTKEGLPQVLVFTAVFGCLLFSALFVLTLLLSLFTGSAHAAETSNMFTPADNDYGVSWIDYLFLGKPIPDLDGSTTTTTQGCFFQRGLSGALSFYSTGVLVFAGFLLLYHLASMVVETAHSGKVMGRANQIWAPIRLVIAIGLLVPIANAASSSTENPCGVSGYNTGQYIVMQLARFGSGLASNVWGTFLDSMDAADDSLDCKSGSPSCLKYTSNEAEEAARSMIASYACYYLYKNYIQEIGLADVSFFSNDNAFDIKAKSHAGVDDDSYATKYLIGTESPPEPALCGGYEMPKFQSTTTELDKEKAYEDAYKAVYEEQVKVFKGWLPTFKEKGKKLAEAARKGGLNDTAGLDEDPLTSLGGMSLAVEVQKTLMNFKNEFNEAMTSKLKYADVTSEKAFLEARGFYETFGWLSAGSWFNTIARTQARRSGALTSGIPKPLVPTIYALTKKTSRFTSDDDGHSVNSVVERTVGERGLAAVNTVFDSAASRMMTSKSLFNDVAETGTPNDGASTFNLIELSLKAIDWIGGFSNVWDSSSGTLAIKFDKTRNPLGELTAWGQNCVRMAATLLTWGAGFQLGGSLMGLLPNALAKLLGKTAGVVGQVLVFVSILLFTAGFMIGFVIPLFPFFRFFFGAVTWLLSIAGAVVMMPLFALAHLSPYGDGLPGQQAKNGYFYLFHILLRPALMVFGLIVGYLLFAASLTFLNAFFVVAAKGTGGYAGSLPTLAKLVYTLIYAGVVFALCNLCFKSIGYFPQTAMGWFGGSAAPEEKMGDPGAVTAAAGYVTNQIMRDVLPKVAQFPSNAVNKHGAALDKKRDEEKSADATNKRHKELMGAVGGGGNKQNAASDKERGADSNSEKAEEISSDQSSSSRNTTAANNPVVDDNDERIPPNVRLALEQERTAQNPAVSHTSTQSNQQVSEEKTQPAPQKLQERGPGGQRVITKRSSNKQQTASSSKQTRDDSKK